MTLDALEPRLLEILNQTNDEQRMVLALLEQQHEAMIQRDLARLGELATELVNRAEQLQNLEQQRAIITREISAQHDDLAGDASLQEIAAKSPTPESLLEVRQSLLDTQQQVTRARDRNQTFASNVLEANDAALRNLIDALRDSGYGPGDTPRVVDRRA